MAPKKGVKRGSRPTEAEPQAKAAKVAKEEDSVLKPVLDCIRSREDLNEDCREMLAAMLPFSLCVPSDGRNELQAMVVKMVDEVFDASLKGMQAAVEEATAAVATAEAAKGEVAAVVTEAEAVLATATEETEANKAAKASATSHFVEMKTALSARESEQKKGDAELVLLRKEKEAFEAVLADDWKVLLEGSWEKPAQQKKLWGAVSALTKKLTLEESMLAALPGALAKKPTERGSFDSMVLQGCEEKFAAKVVELGQQLEAGAPAMTERAAAVEAAQGSLAAAKAAQEAAAEELSAAQSNQKEKVAALKKAKDDVTAAGPACEKAAKELKLKEVDLDDFTKLSLAAFTSLRDASSPKEEEAPAEEAAVPVEEAAAAPAPVEETTA